MSDRDQLILDNLGMVKGIARHISNGLPVHVELDDLVHAGVLGLMDAAGKFDPAKHVHFATYAKHRIRGAILDSLRQLDFASRDLRRRLKQVESVTHELCATLQRNPTETEVAEQLGKDIDQLRKIKREGHTVGQVSTTYRAPKDEEMGEHDFEGKTDTRPDHMFSQLQMRSVLDRSMKPLRPRQQQVVHFYYSEQKTMKEIATSLGINESRVSQLHKSALAEMQTALMAIGVASGSVF